MVEEEEEEEKKVEGEEEEEEKERETERLKGSGSLWPLDSQFSGPGLGVCESLTRGFWQLSQLGS